MFDFQLKDIFFSVQIFRYYWRILRIISKNNFEFYN